MANSVISTKKASINYGLILGSILALFTVLIYALNIDYFIAWWRSFVLFFMVFILGIISVAKSKALLNGFISLKQGFTSYFITIVIGLFILTVINILIFNIIDTGAAEYLNEKVIEVTQTTMEMFGTPEDTINKTLADMEGKNNFSIANQLLGFVPQLIFYSVFGILVALIMKKKDPNQVV